MDWLLKYFTKLVSDPKEKSKALTSLIMLVLILVYAYTFFDVIIAENFYLSNGILLVLFYLIKSIVSDYDPLYSGDPDRNKYTKCFQKILPSKYIMETYDVTMSEAKSLWYNVFNKWSSKEHEMYINWENTLKRGFKCRMVHFTIKSFGFMFIISTITTLVIWGVNAHEIKFKIEVIDLFFTEHGNLTKPFIFTACCLIVYFIFLIVNYPNENKPRGCFLRFNEINGLNIDWLKQNMKSKEDIINYGKKNDNNT